MLVVIVFVVFGDDKYTLNCDGNICKITKAFGTIGLGNILVDEFKQSEVEAYRYDVIRVSRASRHSRVEPHNFYTLYLKLKDGREINTYQCDNRNTAGLSVTVDLLMQSQPLNEVSNYPNAIGRMFVTVHK